MKKCSPRNQNAQNPHDQSILPSKFEYEIRRNGVEWIEYLISIGIRSWPHLTKGIASAGIGELLIPLDRLEGTLPTYTSTTFLYLGLQGWSDPTPLPFRQTHSFFRYVNKVRTITLSSYLPKSNSFFQGLSQHSVFLSLSVSLPSSFCIYLSFRFSFFVYGFWFAHFHSPTLIHHMLTWHWWVMHFLYF